MIDLLDPAMETADCANCRACMTAACPCARAIATDPVAQAEMTRRARTDTRGR